MPSVQNLIVTLQAFQKAKLFVASSSIDIQTRILIVLPVIVLLKRSGLLD